MTPSETGALIIFMKAPRLGLVKTRLAQTLGPDGALKAYEELVNRLLRSLSELPSVDVRVSPDDALSEVAAWLHSSWRVKAQGAGDLGQRLANAFSESFAEGRSKVVMIGSDCPWVQPADIRQAWTALETFDVVLGPAIDGGYWLIGLTEPRPELLSEIAWSTASVLAQTLNRAKKLGLSVHLLRELPDVDTEEDWREFLRQSSKLA